ncbi:MAG: ABC transporter ATP-binding protein/permease [Desulfomonilaceae bacterium]
MFESKQQINRGGAQRLSFWRRFWGLVAPYWSSEEKWSAILLIIVIMSMNLGTVYVHVLLNTWTKDFYNALQQANKAAFLKDLLQFAKLATAYIIQSVYMLYLQQMLQIRWRRWLTRNYLSLWLGHQVYYRMQFLQDATDNPDQRISEDIESFIDLTLTLSIRLLNSVATLASFIAILWAISGNLTLSLGRMGTWTIPGYMVWAAIGYSLLGTWLTMRVGNPLIELNFNQQRYEADFRFSMARLRENSEGVALYRGEKDEGENFWSRFTSVVDNYWKIMRRQKKLNSLTGGYNQIAVIFPVLMAAPRFFAGQMKLGGLMQTASAFGSVHDALSFLVNSYTMITNWSAIMNRLTGFTSAIDQVNTLKDLEDIQRVRSHDGALKVESLDVFLPDNRLLIKDLNLTLAPGSSLLITGPSGSGKSTLIRTLAGIWPFARGLIRLPENATTMFLPQKPYLPMGSLREALYYPSGSSVSESRLIEALDRCQLSHLIPVLDQTDNWSQALSLGEQQRVAFARVLLQRPDFLFLDEATASIDEKMEENLYRTMRSELRNTTVISVAHRSTLVSWHDSQLKLFGDGGWEISDL